ncbi:hypothetical protein KJA16_01175 [Patescibacteria group bacterium]|nr:hypothetical protein [Patescibacteria group bacterium]
MIRRKRLPKSLRKFIRKEKARIRREVLDLKEQEKLILELYPVRKPAVQGKNKENKKIATQEK